MKRPRSVIKLNTLTSAILLPIILIILLGYSPTHAGEFPPLPKQLAPTGDCYDDNIFYGAVPPKVESSLVLVFVHGLSGLAEDWWSANTLAGLNDMYLEAYHAGYRTAFVNLNVNPKALKCSVSRRPAEGVMRNGFVLSQQLETIIQYYNVDEVDVIAHSKGGIDTQAAIVWWGAWSNIRNVFTLATPHQGSILADFLWSPEGLWVSILLGQRDDATYALRTDSMQLFRQATDDSPTNEEVKYYSGAGNFWQTPGSLFERTGAWLQDQPDGGDNDGVVTVASTYLEGAQTLFLEPWNHNEVYLGHNAFPYIHQILLDSEPVPLKIYFPILFRTENQQITE